MSSDIKWIHLSTGMFDDEKIQLIEAMPDNDTILIIWIKLLTLAGKCNHQGCIFISPDIPYNDESLATVLRRPLLTVRLALTTFERYGMLSIDDTGIIFLTNWEKWQPIAGMERIRQLNADRVRRFRDKNKLLTSPDTVNNQRSINYSNNRLDKDKDKDKDKECNANVTLSNVTCNVTSHCVFKYVNPEIWQSYLSMRKKLKAIPTDHAEQLLLDRLENLRLAGHDPQKVVEQSIMNSWRGLFPLPDKPGSKALQRSDKFKTGKYSHMVKR